MKKRRRLVFSRQIVRVLLVEQVAGGLPPATDLCTTHCTQNCTQYCNPPPPSIAPCVTQTC